MDKFDKISELLSSSPEIGSKKTSDDAWKSIRDYLSRLTRGRISGKLRSKLDESDIVQQSLLEAQQDASQIDGTTNATVKKWLRRIVENNVIDVNRQYRAAACRNIEKESSHLPHQADSIVDHLASTASSVLARRELDLELTSAVAKLSADDRRLLESRHKYGRTFAEIGADHGISEQAARKRWNRIVEHLRKELSTSVRRSE